MKVVSSTFVLAGVLALLLAGCERTVFFPLCPLKEAAAESGAFAAYSVKSGGRPDFFYFANSQGRVDRIAYDNDGDGCPDAHVLTDLLRFEDCRHLVIILDGVGYPLIKDYYESGGLRLFHPPSRVVATYPTLTDLCMEDALGHMRCKGMEAEYYDRSAEELAGGKCAYLSGENQPYNQLLEYRANLLWDAIGYVFPGYAFDRELVRAKRTFDKRSSQEFIAYIVTSAGLGTRNGPEGHRRVLRQVEQLVNQIVWETHGLVKVTIFADHGHSYTPAKRIPLEDYLKAQGWRLSEKLQRPRDVVYIRFGLETYASFAAREAAELAADLIRADGVDLASYAQGQDVVVLARDGGKAVIARKGNSYGYRPLQGDPLKLQDVLTAVRADAEGFYDADEVLAATVDHVYPAPLERLWRAHHALVENPPDVIISLENRFYSGKKGFDVFVDVASTHGSLDNANSVTFVMSTAGALPPVMRSTDIPCNIQKLTGLAFPRRSRRADK